ncbi:S-layer homology domain-containing protein (plasmid) [Paenibacillus cellulosilyticus]|nr:S-layer homology domain-containing protein [Paenibacillus cellulosilyticus]QKS47968.1 S-layer homology domain-containing protein [Paenibacillus cellulosilyticus]
MKKSLSMLVASSMVLSMFASAAYAAETTAPTQDEKFAALKELGIFDGFPDGTAGLDQKMTRAQFAKVLTVGTGLEENAAASTYSDVSATHWAKGYIGAVTEAQLMEGVGNNKFDPNGNVTIQELAKTLVLALGLEPVEGATVEGASAWAVGYVQAALDAKIIPSFSNYNVAATRGQLVDAVYAVVADEEETVADLAVSKVSQTGSTAITVQFNRALTADEQSNLTFGLSQDEVSYSVTKAISADATSVTLTADYLAAGTYSVAISGQDAQSVTIVEGKVSKIAIGATSLMVGSSQDLDVTAYDQFGAVVENESFDVRAYNGTTGQNLTVTDDTVDLNSDEVSKGDIIVVSAVHSSTGTSVSKTFTATDASAITSLKLGTVAPLEGNTRITAGDEGLVLPYTFVDADGNKYVLPEGTYEVADGSTNNSVTIGSITFIATGYSASNSQKVVDASTFTVDSDGVLTFNADNDGTVVITALNSSAGASASTTVVVSATADVAKFQMTKPGVLVANGDTVTIPYTATDSYGTKIAATEFAKKDVNSDVTFMVNGQTVTPTWNSKGELKLDINLADNITSGTATVYAVVNGLVSSYFTLDVKAAAVATKVASNNGFATYYSIGGTDDIDNDSVNIKDQYGRVLDSNDYLLVTKKTSNNVANLSGTRGSAFTVTGAATGKETFTVGLDINGDGAIDSGTSIDITVNVIADDKVTAFTIDDLNSVNTVSPFQDESISLVGKTSDGKTVAIDQSRFLTSVTSSNLGAVKVAGTNVLKYVADGDATLTAWNGATKLAEKAVKAGDDAQQAVSVEFDTTEWTLTAADVNTVLANIVNQLEVYDQYGINIAASGAVVGTWTSSDNDILKLNADGTLNTLDVDADGNATGGSVTISYVASNGVIGSVSVYVK